MVVAKMTRVVRREAKAGSEVLEAVLAMTPLRS
jgi:hypothetical protein